MHPSLTKILNISMYRKQGFVRMLNSCILQVNNASCDPPKSANNGDVQYLNVTNVMALNGGADNDNRASDNQQEVCTHKFMLQYCCFCFKIVI